MLNKKILKKTIKITLILSIFAILIVLFSISNVSAYKRLCLTKGDIIPSKQIQRYKCEHDLCQVCATNNNYPTHDGYCRDIKGCSYLEGSGPGGLDTSPPVLTINSPVNNKIYDSRAVLFDIKSSELVTIYYTDNINGRGRFSRLVANALSYYKKISFKDGFNNITMKGTDSNGNSVEILKSFYVDSQKPKITSTFPKKEFATSEFRVWFSEENPKSLALNYGNGINGRKSANINLNSCSHIGGKYYCSLNVSLVEYNNQNIEYSFKLTDIADSSIESRPVALKVDTLAPVIKNPDSMILINGKYVSFKINITEANLLEVSYYDNSDLRPSWKKICTSLKNNICEKKTTFSRGEHIVDVRILDKAGNSAIKRVNFNVDY